MTRWQRLLSIAVAAILLTGVLSGCSDESRSAKAVRAVFADIIEHSTPAYPRPRPADYLADQALQYARVYADPNAVQSVSVKTISWSGDSGDEAGARIEFRIRVHLFSHYAATIGDVSYPDETSTKCFQLTLFGTRNYDTHSESEIGCPAGAAARTPSPTSSPQLDSASIALLTTVLDAATPATLDHDVHSAFPDPRYTIDTKAVGAKLVAAVGVTVERACIAGLRTAGSPAVADHYSGIQLEPGETGCRVDLILNPAR